MPLQLHPAKTFATLCIALVSAAAAAQNAAVPAGAAGPEAPASTTSITALQPPVPAKQSREADDAYLEGARQLEHNDPAAAERSFTRATELDPGNRDYHLALLVARAGRITQLVHDAAVARRAGDTARSDSLLDQARKLDPDNRVIAQHFPAETEGAGPAAVSGLKPPGNPIAATLGGPVELAPNPGVRTFDLRGNPQSLLSQLYDAYGIKANFDPSVSGPATRLTLQDVDFATATRVALQMTHTFAVAIQPRSVLLAHDNPDNRSSFEPLVEETVYIPGATAEQMTDLANIARNIFDVKQVTASASGGDILIRGDEPTLRLLNDTYANILDGGSDVLFDVHLYEIAKTNTRKIGAQLPSSLSFFSIAQEAQNLVNSNQAILNQLIATSGVKLTGDYYTDLFLEAGALILFGGVTDPKLTGLLGTIGTLGKYTNAAGKTIGVPLLGLTVGSGSTFNLLFASSDTRTLDDVQLRSSNRQPANFRAGSRYPIVTAQYSTGVSSALASQLSGLNINGTSVSSLLSKYLGTTTATVPQFQFEDLGLTLKITPQIQHDGDVQMALEMKIESLAGSSVNSIPVLNNRTLTSTITVPSGKTAMLATLVSRSETRSIDGLPYLSELPGFQGTDKESDKESDELLITITPHLVRADNLRIDSRALSLPHTTAAPQ